MKYERDQGRARNGPVFMRKIKIRRMINMVEKVNAVKLFLLSALGSAGSWVINMLGGWTEDLTTLLIFMGVDFLLGFLIAAIWKSSNKSGTGKLNSVSAWKGLVRKGVTLLMVLIAYRLDVTLGVNYIKTAVVVAFIVNEGLSIVENLGIMGVPLPVMIKKALEVLTNKAETEGE